MQTEIIPQLFRSEYSKLVAVLCKTFGMSNIQLAEDIVSDTFLLAAENWKMHGLPDNQTAWLYKVAKNKTRDYLRREKVRVEKVEPNYKRAQDSSYELDIDLSEQNISDSQLRMLFAVCHPILKPEAQIILALRILCGFGIDEIASAMLSNKETINKRLYRAKTSLREKNVQLEFPEPDAIASRLDTVLTTIYLLFSEGYYSVSQETKLRKDFCLEAMRLNLLLIQNQSTNLPKVNALLSLMCFHASRFEARYDDSGEFVLYEDQDRSLWNQALVERGEFYLNQSSTGEQLSKYHLEAAIAFWHTQEGDEEKWENILQLYNYLLQVEYSPIAALNRTYALAKANSTEQALQEALKLDLDKHHLYHCLLAELYAEDNTTKRKMHLEKALDLCKSEQEKKVILKKLEVS